VALEDMDRRGIDVAVLSTSMVLQSSAWADATRQAEFERAANELIAGTVASRAERFVGLGTLPLKSTDRALAELDRLTADGLKGVNLPAQVDGDYLGAPRFHPIWEAIRERELVAFVHPDGARDPWFQDYALWNSVGQPIEEAKALASLILEGVLERYAGLKIVVSHGGGYLPHYVGRLDRNVTNMPDSVRNLSRAPSDYLHELYFDTCVYDVGTLDALVRRYGADHVVMGSDYPVGESDPVAFVRTVLDGTDFDKVAGANAVGLLHL
jgi:aminocarboxymuconate-semialdehyde decarboxylase